MPLPEPASAPSDADTLHIVTDDLRAFPDRRNTMARQVAEDLARRATAAEAGGARRLEETQCAPRDAVWEWDAPSDPDESEPAWQARGGGRGGRTPLRRGC